MRPGAHASNSSRRKLDGDLSLDLHRFDRLRLLYLLVSRVTVYWVMLQAEKRRRGVLRHCLSSEL
jgi:hypothetical protein